MVERLRALELELQHLQSKVNALQTQVRLLEWAKNGGKLELVKVEDSCLDKSIPVWQR